MEYNNLKYVIRVESFEQELSEKYVYKPHIVKKGLFKTRVIEEGIYIIKPMSWEDDKLCIELEEFKTKKEFDKYTVVVNQVFIKPYVKITFVDKAIRTLFFNTFDEANVKAKQITDSIGTIWLRQ